MKTIAIILLFSPLFAWGQVKLDEEKLNEIATELSKIDKTAPSFITYFKYHKYGDYYYAISVFATIKGSDTLPSKELAKNIKKYIKEIYSWPTSYTDARSLKKIGKSIDSLEDGDNVTVTWGDFPTTIQYKDLPLAGISGYIYNDDLEEKTEQFFRKNLFTLRESIRLCVRYVKEQENNKDKTRKQLQPR